MADKIFRTIYTGTNVFVDPIGSDGVFDSASPDFTWTHASPTHTWINTAQNATFSINIPRADVNVFGVTGVLDRPQLEAETATFEFGFIPEAIASPASSQQFTLNPGDLNALIADTIAEAPDYVEAGAPKVGMVTNALMNSATGEASVGALPTFTLSFTGTQKVKADPAMRLASTTSTAGGVIGNAPKYVNNTAEKAVPEKAKDLVNKAVIVTPEDVKLTIIVAGAHVGARVGGDGAFTAEDPQALVDEGFPDQDGDDLIESCAQSASWSWDVPVETVLCLGSDPAEDGLALGNPPGTASFTVEALKEQLVQIPNSNFNLSLGIYDFLLASGNIDSRTHSLAVGDLYGTYNYVIGGTGDGFTVD